MPTWITSPHTPHLTSTQVAVWKATLDWPPDRLPAWSAWLDADEQQRAARFRFPADRNRFIARRVLLRAILGRCLDCPPAQVVYTGSAYGKPYLPSAHPPVLHFNASHSAGLALVAVAIDRELGIDLEQLRLDFDQLQLAERFFSLRERAALQSLAPGDRLAAFFAAWTRKEAYLKAIGRGLAIPLDAFDVSLRPGEPARLLEARQGLPGPESWSLQDLDPAPGFAGAVCVQGQVGEVRCWSLDDPLPWLAQFD